MDATVDKRSETKDTFLNNLGTLQVDPLQGNKRVESVRAEGSKALEELDFPTTRVERWKYTRVKKILNSSYEFHPEEAQIDIDPLLPDENADVLVFINGFFNKGVSRIEEQKNGIHIASLSSSLEDKKDVLDAHFGKHTHHTTEPFTALNAAYATDGALIHIPKNTKAERPVHILHIVKGDGTISQPRNLIVAEEGAEAEVRISYFSKEGGRSFTNAVNEYVVKPNAGLKVDKIQYEEDSVFQIATDQLHQEGDSRFTINTFTLNGALVRNDLNLNVESENCETHLNGLFVLGGQQHVDNHTVVNHMKPNCHSNELYKGVLYDRSTGVFNGKVYVHPHSQKIDAYQSNANILLGDKATIHAKPELEIYADDVSCSHGSTTGQLDDKALFYLRSRGLSKERAESLLILAFAAEVLDKVESEAVHSRILELLQERFGWDY